MTRCRSTGRLSLALVLATATSLPVGAADLNTTLSQSFVLDLDDGLSAVTSARFALSEATRTTALNLAGGASLNWSPDGGLDFTRPSLNLSFSQPFKRSSLSLGASFSQGPVEFDALQPDLTLLDSTGTQTSYGVRGNYTYRFNDELSAGLSASMSMLDFDPPDPELAQSQTYRLGGNISYKANATTDFGLRAGMTQYTADNLTSTENMSFDVAGTMTRELRRDMVLDANLGLAYTNTRDTFLGVTTEVWNTSLIYGAQLSYPGPDGDFVFGLDQSLRPTAAGSLQVGTGISVGYTQQVNATESISLAAEFQYQRALNGSGGSSLLVLSPSYVRRLTPDIQANAGINLSFGSNGLSESSINLGLSRSFRSPL